MADRFALTRDELRKDLGFQAGFGRTAANWSTDQSDAIEMAIKRGCRRAYFQALAQGGKAYQWSFLRQQYLFSTVEGKREYDLPLDFCAHEGDLFFDDSSTGYAPVKMVNEAKVREMASQAPTLKSLPYLACVREKRQQGITAPQKELLMFPLPDGAYAMRLPYQITQEMPSATITHFPGGPIFADVLRFACLAALASEVTGMPNFEREYQEAVVAAISQDSRNERGHMGLNTDPGVERRDRFFSDERYVSPTAYTITIDGNSSG